MRGWESRGGSYPVCHREALSARAAGGSLARGRLRVELCDPVKELAEHSRARLSSPQVSLARAPGPTASASAGSLFTVQSQALPSPTESESVFSPAPQEIHKHIMV